MQIEGTNQMTEQELIINYNRLLKENEELNNQVEAYKEVLETRREHAFKADERYFDLCEENKRLKDALQMIAKGMDINPPDPLREQVVGYFRGIAEATLKGE
jgi:hypothetical protein